MHKEGRKCLIISVLALIILFIAIYLGSSLLYLLGKAIFDKPITVMDIEREKLYLEYADKITILQQEFKQRAEEINKEFEEKSKMLNEKENKEGR